LYKPTKKTLFEFLLDACLQVYESKMKYALFPSNTGRCYDVTMLLRFVTTPLRCYKVVTMML